MNMDPAGPPRAAALRPPPALLAAVACLGAASLLHLLAPAWFVDPPGRSNFLGNGAPFLLLVILLPRYRWALRLTQLLALASAALALWVGMRFLPGHLPGWIATALLCALAFGMLTWPASVREYFSARRG